MISDLKSIGMDFARWQDAVEAAIASQRLEVTGEVRGGQLIRFSDESGAQINILAVEPFATYVGFSSSTVAYGHVSMINDVLALIDIIDPFGNNVTTVTANLAQGPLLVDEPVQRWQMLAVTALGVDVQVDASADEYLLNGGEVVGMLTSEGALQVASGSGATVPDASAEFSARVLSSEYRTNALTGQRFIHATVDGYFAFDLCLPDAPELPARDSIVSGKVLLAASVIPQAGGGCGSDGGGCGSGSCGCGGH
ncbi:hypothetical protein [Corynebacterium gallinarum]|uniref:Uncharacterized protein n=1 Tax=Corynebacterium gallinarum TaxID=2762214 RepID=A0A8I0HLA4_9CORY|nr:hypothetical protein [Corynebacterium gallinarum]MBD8028734.1 hypothetical protein [Corynebacterium gallinarum]